MLPRHCLTVLVLLFLATAVLAAPLPRQDMNNNGREPPSSAFLQPRQFESLLSVVGKYAGKLIRKKSPAINPPKKSIVPTLAANTAMSFEPMMGQGQTGKAASAGPLLPAGVLHPPGVHPLGVLPPGAG